MNKIFETYRPDGFGTVNGYLFAENPKELIGFLKKAFYAEEINRSTNSKNGDIANVILKIGTKDVLYKARHLEFGGDIKWWIQVINATLP